MARIRSIHPGIFTDEAFASLSMPARVLLLGIWTEADDHGIFEWKPITLKMRIMPVDNVDVGGLLGELLRADVVKSFTVGGRPFGLVRNFCRYQRPKKPSYKHVMPDELRTYAGLDGGSTEPVPNQLPTRPENPPQMEEEGGKREEEGGKILSVASDRVSEPDRFEEFWKLYPRREGPNPRKPAETRFKALVKTGLDAQMLIDEVRKFAALDETRRQTGSRFIPQAVTWLNQQRWSDHAAVAFLADDLPREMSIECALSQFARIGSWSRFAPGAAPGEPGCVATAEQLAAAGLDANGRKLRSSEAA